MADFFTKLDFVFVSAADVNFICLEAKKVLKLKGLIFGHYNYIWKFVTEFKEKIFLTKTSKSDYVF